MQSSKSHLSFLIMALGVAFEHFDMMLVSLLTSSLVEEFVGASTPALKMLFAYIGYAIAFLFRPLGAFYFGCIGDLYGRKTSLVSSMCLMSAATLALAFIPGVQVLGVTSTLLFLLCRIAQGLAVGGEYGTAMTYAYELNSKYRTFFGACVVSSTHVGGVFASFLASQYVDHVRVTFLIGGLVGFFLLLFRSLMKEYHVATAKKVSEITAKSVKNKKAILSALIVASTMVLVFYGSLIYLNERVHQDLEISRAEIFKANTVLLGLWIVLPPCFGYIADKLAISYRKLMRFGAMGVFLSAPLLGVALVSSSYTAVVTTQILTHLFLMIFALCTPRFFGDLFSGEARNTAISTTYSLGASFTSALAPAICHGSIVLFNTNFAICVPFMLAALATGFILKKEDVCNRMTLLNSMTSR
ncbi:MAG: MFS transporter [Parachlamydiales bacterium]|jgi:MFS family permease